MGWVIDLGIDELYAHEGYPMDVFDGGTSRAGGEQEAVAYVAACSCGWRGARGHRIAVDRVRDAETGRRTTERQGAEEVAEDSAYRDWQRQHMDAVMAAIEVRTTAAKLRRAEAEVLMLQQQLDAAMASARGRAGDRPSDGGRRATSPRPRRAGP
jgi:hypothetical protein